MDPVCEGEKRRDDIKTQILNPQVQNHNLNPKSDVKHRAYYFSLKILQLVQLFPEKYIYKIISGQLIRSATSIEANLIEARGSSSKKDFARFYEIALKSANETEYWLMLLRDSNLIHSLVLDACIKEVNEISRMIGASLLTMRGKRI